MCISDWSSDVCSSDLALLSSLGIEVVADAPDVGRNLLEHRYLSTQYRVRGESLNARFGGFGLFRSVLEYTLRSKGPLTHSAHEVGGFVKTRPGLVLPYAQIGMGLYSIGPDEKGAIAIRPYPGLNILGSFPMPESQGEITLHSPAP